MQACFLIYVSRIVTARLFWFAQKVHLLRDKFCKRSSNAVCAWWLQENKRDIARFVECCNLHPGCVMVYIPANLPSICDERRACSLWEHDKTFKKIKTFKNLYNINKHTPHYELPFVNVKECRGIRRPSVKNSVRPTVMVTFGLKW